MPRTLPRLLTPFRVQRPDTPGVAAGLSAATGAADAALAAAAGLDGVAAVAAAADGCAAAALDTGLTFARSTAATAVPAAVNPVAEVPTAARADRRAVPAHSGCISGIA